MGIRSGSKLGFVLPVFVAAWVGCHDSTEPPQPVSVRITPAEGLTLLPGDLILTGTPSGVGPIHAGDELEARIGDWPPLCNSVGVAG